MFKFVEVPISKSIDTHRNIYIFTYYRQTLQMT